MLIFQQQNKVGNKQRTKNNSHKTEQGQADNYTEECNERMYVANFFLQCKTKYIVKCRNVVTKNSRNNLGRN